MGVFRARSLRTVLAGSLLFGGLVALAVQAQIASARIRRSSEQSGGGRLRSRLCRRPIWSTS